MTVFNVRLRFLVFDLSKVSNTVLSTLIRFPLESKPFTVATSAAFKRAIMESWSEIFAPFNGLKCNDQLVRKHGRNIGY